MPCPRAGIQQLSGGRPIKPHRRVGKDSQWRAERNWRVPEEQLHAGAVSRLGRAAVAHRVHLEMGSDRKPGEFKCGGCARGKPSRRSEN